MSETSDTRTPAQIEADIERRRQRLAETLDEIGVRVHPRTIAGDAKAKAAAAVDRTLGRAYAGAHRTVSRVTGKFTTDDGGPRLERIVPVAIVVVGVVGLLTLGGSRKRGD
ncbi:DUF3618 domain-containing protein [Streptomyces sp. JNUCC 64]